MTALGALVAVVLALPPFTVMYAEEWHVFSRSGEYLRKLDNFGGESPNAVAVAPDGVAFAFTTGKALFFVESPTSAPRKLGPEGGYLTEPTFDAAGRWIYFIYHGGPEAGPVGYHGTGANAQLWKVQTDGEGLTQLTTSKGCKRQPEVQADGTVLLIHSTCDGRSAIESFGKDIRELLSAEGANLEARRSPDGKLVAFFRRLFNGADIMTARNNKALSP